MSSVKEWNESWNSSSNSGHTVLDNFLEIKQFEGIAKAVTENVSPHWTYTDNVSGMGNENTQDYFMMTCSVYRDSIIRIPHLYSILTRVLTALEVKSLIRIKCNLYPSTSTLSEHRMHIDSDYSHKGGILYLNTCNGYTRLEDGTKIESIANRMLLFDAGNPHCSSTCTNQKARFNINFNYF